MADITIQSLVNDFNEAEITDEILIPFLRRARVQYSVDSLTLQIQGMEQARQAANAATDQAISVLRQQINDLNQSLVPVA